MARYKAKLDGWDLIMSPPLTDSVENALAIYKMPFVRGAKIDRMGSNEHITRFKCYFANATYDDHYGFFDYVTQDRVFTLVHPEIGLLKGAVQSISRTFDTRKRCAEIDLVFIEDIDTAGMPSYEQNVVSATESAFVTGQAAQQDLFASDLVSAVGADDAGSLLETPIAGSGLLLSRLQGVPRSSLKYLKSLSEDLKVLESSFIAIENSSESIVAATPFGSGIAGFVCSTISQALDRCAMLSGSSALGFINTFISSINALAASVTTLSSQIIHAAAQLGAVKIAQIYDADEISRQEIKGAQDQTAFSADGSFIGQEKMPVIMTINEIEESLAKIRGLIQRSIDLQRSSGSNNLVDTMKKISRVLLEHCSRIKLEREKIINVFLTSEMPLHVVCQRYGLSYRYAEQICSINSFSNPLFITGNLNIYAR
jgi:hypothetical protein